ncbi:hypothetical protein [Nonomuraea cavernae]|uniref:Uncharacterized protein n=1 Tax=Nonomuraea cavernae TaxID=2045107 RepID=A0A917ZKH1_9ACTN|nr:hypothetical protein [Nonomuraea cavernae]MCA2190954.1 hypothetical protein [Nonomuraea cavernae]GGO83477.1 hypothetical protein GCM10012289_77020 [Nonomuraea cavernae]
MTDPGQQFAQWFAGQRHTRTRMGNAASPGAIPEGTDLQATTQAAVDAQLAGTHAEHTRRIDNIRARTAPTDQARRVGLARAHRDAKRERARLREQALEDLEEARFVLESKLYGSGGHAPTNLEADRRRQAQLDAAELNDPREAAHALKIAHRNGDRIAAQAIFERAAALETSIVGGAVWSPIVRQYVERNPRAAEDLNHLRSLPNLGDARTRMAFEARYLVQAPDELAGLSDGQIDQLAATEMAD